MSLLIPATDALRQTRAGALYKTREAIRKAASIGSPFTVVFITDVARSIVTTELIREGYTVGVDNDSGRVTVAWDKPAAKTP